MNFWYYKIQSFLIFEIHFLILDFSTHTSAHNPCSELSPGASADAQQQLLAALSVFLAWFLLSFFYIVRLRILECLEGLAWPRRPSFVRPSVRTSVKSSVNSGFSETAAWIQVKFYGRLPIYHISSLLFSFCKIFSFHILTILFSFSLTWNNIGAKISKRYSSYTFIWSERNVLINKVVMGEKVMDLLAICQKF